MTEQTTQNAKDGDAYAFNALGKALVWDYARGIFALLFTGGIAAVMAPGSIAWFVIAALLLAIIGYLLNTVYRHGLRVEMTDAGVTSGWRNPLRANGPILLARRHLPWDGLTDFQMRYFSRKREGGQDGWIMVRLKGTGNDGAPVTLTFDGAHEGFHPVLNRGWEHARRRGLALDDTTIANLEGLGFSTTGPQPWTS